MKERYDYNMSGIPHGINLIEIQLEFNIDNGRIYYVWKHFRY